MIYLLDTHAWVWACTEPDRLSPPVRRILGFPARYERLILSAVSILEIGTLVAKGRLRFSMPFADWIEHACRFEKFQVVDLTPQIATEAAQLPEPFHFDPADRAIVATARCLQATVVTADRLIRNYPNVRTIW